MRLLISGSWVRAPRWANNFLANSFVTFNSSCFFIKFCFWSNHCDVTTAVELLRVMWKMTGNAHFKTWPLKLMANSHGTTELLNESATEVWNGYHALKHLIKAKHPFFNKLLCLLWILIETQKSLFCKVHTRFNIRFFELRLVVTGS